VILTGCLNDYTYRFNISLLTKRLVGVAKWLEAFPAVKDLPIGFFGASTGAASALKAAAVLPHIYAVVSRGGRPDLAMEDLKKVVAPTLLIVGSLDEDVLSLNESAYKQLQCPKKLEIVQGATHLFEEPGKMSTVSELAANWFKKCLQVTDTLKAS
jgi:putative phosphoribosyl transferase